jgi:hypothetical protein
VDIMFLSIHDGILFFDKNGCYRDKQRKYCSTSAFIQFRNHLIPVMTLHNKNLYGLNLDQMKESYIFYIVKLE